MRFSWRFLIQVIALLLAGRAVHGDELPTAEDVRQRFREWRRDLVAFRMRYEIGEVAGAWEGKQFREFLMTDSHDYLDIEETFWPDKAPTRDVRGGNAESRFVANYVSTDIGGSWKLVSLREDRRLNSRIGSAKQLAPLTVMLHPHSGLWMDEDYFTEHEVKVVSREEIDGESCIVLDVSYQRDGGIDGNGSRIWVAENKGFLVKKLTPNQGPPEGRRDADYLCTEFRQVEGIWYPAQGFLLLPPEQSFWTVTLFEVNPPIEAEKFLAPSKAGLVARTRVPVASETAASRVNRDRIPVVPDATPRDSNTYVLRGIGILICMLGLSGWWFVNRSS